MAIARRHWPPAPWRRFIGFFAASYFLWLVQFGIQRYLVPLELISGIALIGAVLAVSPTRRHGLLVASLVAIAVVASTRPLDTWRRPWTNTYPTAALPSVLETPRLYFLLNRPVAFVISRLPAEARFFQLADDDFPILPGSSFDRRIRSALANEPALPVWSLGIVGQPASPSALAALRTYGYRPSGEACVIIPSAIFVELEFCPLRRVLS
jgi:hypothetical protein